MIRCRKKSGLAVKAAFPPGHSSITGVGQWAMPRGSNPLSVESYPPSIPGGVHSLKQFRKMCGKVFCDAVRLFDRWRFAPRGVFCLPVLGGLISPAKRTVCHSRAHLRPGAMSVA